MFQRVLKIEKDTQVERWNTEDRKLCSRCGEPVVVRVDDYDLFEKMHWLCFHLEFEHHSDPDEPCQDPSCPLWHVQVYRTALSDLGHDPEAILAQALENRYSRSEST